MPWRRATRATTRPACSSRGYGPAKVAAAAWAAAAASEALLVGAVVPATRASSLRVGCCSRLGARSKASSPCTAPTSSRTKSSRTKVRARSAYRGRRWARCGRSTWARASKGCSAAGRCASCSTSSVTASSAYDASAPRTVACCPWCSTRRYCLRTRRRLRSWPCWRAYNPRTSLPPPLPPLLPPPPLPPLPPPPHLPHLPPLPPLRWLWQWKQRRQRKRRRRRRRRGG
mmetsp:Transcript_22064/g.52762  ORF Transcript_22064/g.52762 Transcript_22064/m.52762 type:complete len:229 (-) Transcript_22064:5-691(-)